MMMQTTHFQQEHARDKVERYQREATIERDLRVDAHEPPLRAARRNPLFRLALAPRT